MGFILMDRELNTVITRDQRNYSEK
ncbi:hypothetical protein KSF78_0008686 [Schistosoma japonicum]|nr:hypothetical protein KSF78_0008686 [Schistosoma japonicum]